MGRDASITYEQVAAAAVALQAAGVKPTSRGVREQLGHTGSMGTVHKLLQQWLAAQERRPGELLALPPVLERALLDFLAQQLEQGKAALQVALTEQQQEAAALAVDNERLAGQFASQAEASAAQGTELATLRGRQAQIEGALAGASEELSKAHEATAATRIELAKALLRLEALPRLEADLASLRAELAVERQARIDASQHVAVLAVQLEAATARADRAEAVESEARAQVATSRDAMAQEASRAEAAQHTIAHLNGRVEAMQAQIGRQATALELARQPVVAPPTKGGPGRRAPERSTGGPADGDEHGA